VEQIKEQDQQPLFWTLYYWMLLFITLLVVDDATFGWIFWVIAQFSLIIAAVTAFVIYWVVGYWLTLRGLSPKPGKMAGWLLNRLQLGHPNKAQHEFEQRAQSKITSIASAVPMTLLFGGVFTTLWLHRRGIVANHRARRLGFWLCGLYALEPTVIHALGIGGLILLVRHQLGL
jgi:hypothetical protein